MAPRDADRNLLFGLLALQNGLVDQARLVAAFQAWTLDKLRPLADHLVALGHLDPDQRGVIDALAALHLKKHGGSTERSLAAIPVDRSTRESLARVGDPAIEASLPCFSSDVASTHPDSDPDRTGSYAVGTATSDGQRFRVLRPHAKGGLGAVYVALDSELNREVALKQILDSHADDPASRQRFLLEAEITGGLEHPGIVPVYGLGTYRDGRPYYAMRLIKGESLKQAIEQFHQRAGWVERSAADQRAKAASTVGLEDSAHPTRDSGAHSLELRMLLRRFTDVCNAIDYAHSRGVLHRDIKPGNVIVGRYGETLVVDWGLAKATGKSDAAAGERTLLPSSASGSSETLPGSALGTPAYMSPEQAEGDLDRLSPRSDVYSLGATLYCLLTGQPPFAGDVADVIRAVRRGEFRPPRQLDSTIDPALEAVCLKAMAHEPADRYATPRALAEDVEKWAADEPVSAWSEPLARRARRWARRNRTAVTAASVAVVASVVGLAAVLFVQTQAKGELARSLASETKANRELAVANAELARSQAAVQARYDLAVDAIKTFHTGVSEDFLLKEQQFKELRDRLLTSASGFYGKLGALLGRESDPASRLALARANFEVAELTGKVGRQGDALAAHRNVLAARQALASEPGSGDEAKADVGRSLTAIGVLLESTGKAEEAVASYREAERRLAGLPAPASAGVRAAVAYCRSRLGWLLHETGRTAQALSMLRLARAGQQVLADAAGATDGARNDLAWTVNRIGLVLSATGKATEAEAEYRAALAIQEALAHDNPTVTDFRSSLADTHINLGIVLASMGKPSDTEVEYRAALAINQKVADDNPAVAEFRSRLATSHNNLANLLSETGKPSEAEAEYRTALAIYQKLADDNPTVTDFRLRLAVGHMNFGALLSYTGKASEAEAECRLALSIQQKLADLNPAVTEFRSKLADSHNNLGILLAEAGKVFEAEAEFRAMLAIQVTLADDNPAVTDFRNRLALSHHNLGALLWWTGKGSAAEAEYRAALAILGKLADLNPAVTDIRDSLGRSHNNLGLLLLSSGKAAAAEAEYRAALAIYQKLAETQPALTSHRGNLAAAAAYLAAAHLTLGRDAEARAVAEDAVALREKLVQQDPQSIGDRAGLGEALLRRGQARLAGSDLAGAAADWRRAIAAFEAMPPRQPDMAFIEACCHAMLAGAAGRTGSGVPAGEGPIEAGRAIDILRRAVAMGYRNADYYRTEPALGPLRGRDDYRVLMMDLAMPDRPVAP